MQKVLEKSRYLVIIAVVGAYLAATIVIIYSGLLLVRTVFELFTHPEQFPHSARQIVLECIEVIDAFLLGLYVLFINPASNAPRWLRVHDFDDLKARLLGVIIVVLSVFFLEQVINWDGKQDILSLGIAEALMIGVISLAIRIHQHEPGAPERNEPNS